MAIKNIFQQISWKALLIGLLITVVPNFLLMKVELLGNVNSAMALGTVLDLAIILPLIIYFFVLRRKPSFIIFIPLSFAGLFLANWFIPDYASEHLYYINKTVIVVEASLILIELLLMIIIFKKLPLLKRNTLKNQETYYHFLRSFIEASKETYSFRFKKLNSYQKMLRFLSTDLAVFYYVFFSWRKKAARVIPEKVYTFSFHKNGEYLGIFIMLVHALTIEIIAVHLLVMQYSHALAWVVTMFDIYALLFLIADYQAIRQSPVIVDEKGIHIQKGLRFHTFIPFNQIESLEINKTEVVDIKKDKKAFDITLNGLESTKPQYVLELKETIQAFSVFGIMKSVERVYFSLDESNKFYNLVSERIQKEIG